MVEGPPVHLRHFTPWIRKSLVRRAGSLGGFEEGVLGIASLEVPGGTGGPKGEVTVATQLTWAGGIPHVDGSSGAPWTCPALQGEEDVSAIACVNHPKLAQRAGHGTMTNLYNILIVPGNRLETLKVVDVTFSTSLALLALESEIRLIYIKMGCFLHLSLWTVIHV